MYQHLWLEASTNITPSGLQNLILAYIGIITVLVPVIGALAVLVVQQYGKVKEAVSKVNAINGTIEHHTQTLIDVTKQVQANATKIETIENHPEMLTNGK